MSSSLKRSWGAQPLEGSQSIKTDSREIFNFSAIIYLITQYIQLLCFSGASICKSAYSKKLRKTLLDLMNAEIVGFDEYFLQKHNAAGRLGFSPSQKITLALRMMAYGCSADSIDEYAHMSKSSSHFLHLS
jgi:hypothetical protein